MQIPSVGRQVHYISQIDEQGNVVDPWAATIVKVNEDGSVNLDVVSPYDGRHTFVENRLEADDSDPNPASGLSGRWMWPPRMTPVHTPQVPIVS